MSEKYEFHDPQGMYFVTMATVGWVDLFRRFELKHVIIDSLRHCQKEKGLVIHTIAQAAFESVRNVPDWTKSILNIKRLEGNVGFESFYTKKDGIEIPIDTEANYQTSLAVHELHKFMANTFGENSKWNRLKFFLYPDNKINVEYIWDQALQDEVDKYNNASQA